jgi:hypothetical protein
MVSSLDIDGKQMRSIKYVSAHSGYSRDYITKLAREGKIVAAQIGRNWFVDQDSVAHYAGIMEVEQKSRQQQLSEERKRELQIKEALEKKAAAQVLHRRRLARQSKVMACAVLLLGLTAGFALNQLPTVSTEITRQVASAPLVQAVSGKAGSAAGADVGVADTLPAGALNFSHEAFRLETLSDSSQGILLLPNATTSETVNPEDLFSDEVQILTDDNGMTFAARVDAAGEVVEKIPFVVVPVNNKQTP